jgi:hypothetical protein
MKIEQLLVQHFYNNGEVTLQGMGTFTLSTDFVAPKENDKEVEIPDNAISFYYNPRATEDDKLITYIVEQTRKMKALAAADLDSYLVLGKQFLNIGKPFKIEGMGILVKTQQGDLAFTKGHSFHAKAETAHAALKEKTVNPEISFASETKKTEGSNKKGLLLAGIVIALVLIAATAWYFLSKKNTGTADNSIVNIDTPKTDVPKTDTIIPKTIIPTPANDGYTFKVVFFETIDSAAAVARMNVWTVRHHKVIMYKKDPGTFALAEPFTLPLTDTAHIKDSLNRFYYSGKGLIELK